MKKTLQEVPKKIELLSTVFSVTKQFQPKQSLFFQKLPTEEINRWGAVIRNLQKAKSVGEVQR